MSLALLTGAGCHGSPTGPSSPTPTPTPPVPGGTITGAYILTVDPASGCGLASPPYSLDVEATPTGSASRPEVRVTLPGGAATLSVSLVYTGPASVDAALGTQVGVPVAGGLVLFFRAFGSGNVTHADDGRGQVLDGQMSGDVAVGAAGENPSTCTSDDHHWSLRAH